MQMNVGPVKFSGLPDDDAFDINPVLGPGGKGFEDNQIFGRTSAEISAARKCEQTGSRDSGFLEGQGGQGNVQSDPGWSAQKQDTVSLGKFSRLLNPRLESRQESVNKFLFCTKTRDEGEISINRLAWFTPPLQSKAANETETPALGLADGLKFRRGSDDLNHGVWLS